MCFNTADMDVTPDPSPEPTPADSLPTDLQQCHAMILELLASVNSQQRTIGRLEHQLQDLLRRVYGRSSEKIDPNQLPLFKDLLEQLRQENDLQPAEEPQPEAKPKSKPNGHGRRKLPADLPRECVVHELPEAEKACPCCGGRREEIGEDVSEHLDYIPAKVFVTRHIRKKYLCRACEQSAAETGPQMVTADKPRMPIEKGLAGPGLLAHVLVSKYDDHLPLHRLERILKRHGIEIARSTMWDWVRQTTDALGPLYDLMAERVLGSKVLHTDDTPVDVQDRHRTKTRQGRFWIYLGDDEHPYDVYAYTPSRSRDGPMAFLAGWGQDERRYLQADAFGGYDDIYAGDAGGQVTEVACWAHARRKFKDAGKSDHARSSHALATIRVLYDIEAELKDATPAERAAVRAAKARPVLERFGDWLRSQQIGNGACQGEAQRRPVLPKSPMGEAIQYALNQWDALCVYTTDGDLSIDNNAAERGLRRVAVGRKNWLFLGGDAGGHAGAVALSLLGTCRRHNIEPLAYLRDILSRMPSHPSNRLADLLPDRWQPAAD